MRYLLTTLVAVSFACNEAKAQTLTCVQYVKQQQPGYAGRIYPRDPSGTGYWVQAKDIYNNVFDGTALGNRKRGPIPVVGGLFVLSGPLSPGHCGIVTAVQKNGAGDDLKIRLNASKANLAYSKQN